MNRSQYQDAATALGVHEQDDEDLRRMHLCTAAPQQLTQLAAQAIAKGVPFGQPDWTVSVEPDSDGDWACRDKEGNRINWLFLSESGELWDAILAELSI